MIYFIVFTKTHVQIRDAAFRKSRLNFNARNCICYYFFVTSMTTLFSLNFSKITEMLTIKNIFGIVN